MSETNRNYVELRHIDKRFGDVHVSRGINIAISDGALVALLGPSGSGKTTILRMIAGLEQPDSGQILINGQVVNDVPGSERGVGFVFQNYALFRYMNVYENIAFGLRVKKLPRAEIDERVRELLALIGCEGLEKRYPRQLSGGQRQRVAFARALAPRPRLLLLDEPFAAIDAKVRQELRTWLRNMISRIGITSIFVTHDQEEAFEVADEIIVTNQGHVEQIGSPRQLYCRPATAFVAQFIGNSTTVPDCSPFRFFAKAKASGPAVIRPEFIRAFKRGEAGRYAQCTERGVVEDVLFRGGSQELRIRLCGCVLSAMRGIDEAPMFVGEAVDVLVRRMFVLRGDSVELLCNEALAEAGEDRDSEVQF